ncbi:hypothetical protein Tco_0171001, partial [Tanacetum coccineum]
NSTNDDKTKSDKDCDHGDDSDKSYNEDESVDYDNDDSDKDFDDYEDQTTGFEICAHDKEPEQTQREPQSYSPSVTITSHEDVSRYLIDPPKVQMTELLNEPMYTETTTLAVVPLFDTIH